MVGPPAKSLSPNFIFEVYLPNGLAGSVTDTTDLPAPTARGLQKMVGSPEKYISLIDIFEFFSLAASRGVWLIPQTCPHLLPAVYRKW